MALKSDYNVNTASEATKDAMRDRCHEQGHEWENGCDVLFNIYMFCKWCGAEK